MLEPAKRHGIRQRTCRLTTSSGAVRNREGLVMLNDAEQRTLTEIETGLRQDDSAFVQRFADIGWRSRRPTRSGEIVRTWLIIGVLALGFGWLLKNALLVIVGLSALSVAITWWAVPVDIDGRAPRDGRIPR
jgi:hypothetical protein